MTKTAPAASAPIAAPGVSRFAGLDGLRAIAVLLVMFFHLSPGFVPGGYLGVDVFFVISGFLITALLLREKAKTGRIRLVGEGKYLEDVITVEAPKTYRKPWTVKIGSKYSSAAPALTK